jgi:hypothetical protein
MNINKTNIPTDSLIYRSFDRIDYQDAYSVEEAFNKQLTPEDVVKSFFKIFPSWIKLLLHIRNIIVKPFGLETSDPEVINRNIDSFKGKIDETIRFFKVYDRSKDEIMLGADDKHLDARLSFILKKNQNRYQIMLITIVHFNYWLGNAYFFFVKPFHKVIIKASLRGMAVYLKNQ